MILIYQMPFFYNIVNELLFYEKLTKLQQTVKKANLSKSYSLLGSW